MNVPQQGALVQQVPVPVPAVASQQLPMEWAAEDAVLNYIRSVQIIFVSIGLE